MLGRLYFNGDVVPRDHEKALRHFERPVTGGYAPALYWYGLLGFNWEGEQGLRPTPEQMFNAARQAAEAGHTNARLLVARLHETGFDSTGNPNFPAALEIYESGDAAGVVEATYRLGNCLLEEKNPQRDLKAAFAAFQRAAEKNHPGAWNMVGMCHLRGWGTPADPAAALAAFRKAADLGLWLGGRNASKLLATGQGVAVADPVAARDLLERVSEKASPQDQREAGRLFLGKDFLPADPERARTWLKRASNAGEPEAAKLLGELNASDANQPANYAELLSLREKAAAANDPEALFALLETYLRDPALTEADRERIRAYGENKISFQELSEKQGAAFQRADKVVDRLYHRLEKAGDTEGNRVFQYYLRLAGEPSEAGEPSMFRFRSVPILNLAANRDHPEALYWLALSQRDSAFILLAIPDTDRSYLERYGILGSDGNFHDALRSFRAAAKRGHTGANEFLSRRGIPLEGPTDPKVIDRAAIPKVKEKLPGDPTW